MAQQTAVEWLVQWLKDNPISYGNSYNEAVEQAKAMEKEHHANTWIDSRVFDKGDDYIGKTKSFEQYYKETYQSNQVKADG